MTGNYKVPSLVLDDGTIIDGSQNIIDWAGTNGGAWPSRSSRFGRKAAIRFAWKAAVPRFARL